jgi:hypothetical protein
LVDGCTPTDIAMNLDLTGYKVIDMTAKINAWLGDIQQSANVLESYKSWK